MKFLLRTFTTIVLLSNAVVFFWQYGDWFAGLASALLAGANGYAAIDSLY